MLFYLAPPQSASKTPAAVPNSSSTNINKTTRLAAKPTVSYPVLRWVPRVSVFAVAPLDGPTDPQPACCVVRFVRSA